MNNFTRQQATNTWQTQPVFMRGYIKSSDMMHCIKMDIKQVKIIM